MQLGDIEIVLQVNEPNVVAECKDRLEAWKQLRHVLNLIHVTKPLDLSLIAEEQNKTIDILIATIGTGKSVKIGHTQSTLNMAEVGNLRLLLWESVDNEGNSFSVISLMVEFLLSISLRLVRNMSQVLSHTCKMTTYRADVTIYHLTSK